MKIIKIIITSTVFTFFSCSKENEEIAPLNTENSTSKELKLSQKQISAFDILGINTNGNNINSIKADNIFTKEDQILVGDIMISNSQLNSVIKRMSNNNSGSARLDVTKDRVIFPEQGKRTIQVGLFVDRNPIPRINANFDLNPKQVNACITAIQRLQAVNMAKLNFEFVFINSLQDLFTGAVNPDILIRSISESFMRNLLGPRRSSRPRNSGDCPKDNLPRALATIPFDGNPGNDITLLRGDDAEQEFLTKIVQHELLHTLGIPHSDHLTARSCVGIPCGPQGSEGINIDRLEEAPRGAVNQAGDIINSIMTTCSNSNIKTFTQEDLDSLRSIYGGEDF